MNRKAISGIFMTILILLLSSVAIMVVWQVLKPGLEKSAAKITFGCIEISLKIDNLDCAAGSVVVKRNAGEADLIRIKFAFSNDTETNIVEKEVDLDELETKTYSFDIEDISGADGVNIAPVIMSEGGEEIVCEFITPKPIAC